jgi:5-amino-6-(5-phosphoribosylamino)uracil reductase
LLFRQLIPRTRLVEAEDLVGGLDLAARAGEDRPYTVVNFISSADGRATFHGRSAPLGDPGDRELFHALREQAEAVLAGTTTIAVERYGRLIPDPDRRRRRVDAGQSAEPLACVVTRSGEVPTDAPLFAEPEARIVVFGPVGLDLGRVEARVEVVELDPGELTLTTAMRRLRSGIGIRSLLCEGGPTMFGALLMEGLVDELFLTFAPKLTGGGTSHAITSGPQLPEIQPLELIWALEHENSLYLRYALRR